MILNRTIDIDIPLHSINNHWRSSANLMSLCYAISVYFRRRSTSDGKRAQVMFVCMYVCMYVCMFFKDISRSRALSESHCRMLHCQSNAHCFNLTVLLLTPLSLSTHCKKIFTHFIVILANLTNQMRINFTLKHAYPENACQF